MDVLDLGNWILVNENYENKFNLPDGIIKFIVNSIQFIFPIILISCVVVISISFWKLLTAKTYEKNTWPTLLLVTSITFLAFCLSVSLNDLDFTIFKTIVPTVAGITALALFLQNDQKNRMELNDRHKEYRKSIIIDRKNRHSDAIKTINTDEEKNIQVGLRQLRSLLIEWLQDNPSNNYEKYEKRNEIINITDEVSAVLQKNTNLKNKKSSSIEEAALSFANMARGGWYVSPTTRPRKVVSLFNFYIRYRLRLFVILLYSDLYEVLSSKDREQRTIKLKPKIIKYLQKIIDERLIAQDLSNNWLSSKYQNSRFFNAIIHIPTKSPASRRLINFHVGDSIDKNTYSFNFKEAKIDSPIKLSGFQGVDFTKSKFRSKFIIKPDYQNIPDAYLIDTKFQGSTFRKSTSFILTKFLFNYSEPPFSNVTFMKPVTFKSCVFLAGSPIPHDFIIKESNFQHKTNSLIIEDSLFNIPLSLKDSSIPNAKLSKNYFAFGTTITEVESEQIKFESCNLESLSVEKIKQIHEGVPEIKIKNSTVRQETNIYSTIDIHVNGSRFKKNSIFGRIGVHPANKVNISKSVFSGLEISASSEIKIQGISVEKLDIFIDTNSPIDVLLQGILGFASEITIDGLDGQIRSLILNDIYVKKIHFLNINFSQVENIELENVKCKEIHFEDCMFAYPDQKEDIKRLAGSQYKINNYDELIEDYECYIDLEDYEYYSDLEDYEYYSDLEDLGM